MSLIPELTEIARQAGERILGCYAATPAVTLKDDQSPLTAADAASHAHISDALSRLTPDIPILSEESLEQPAITARYWCVDPLDGTKEFIKKTGEFTVNIALIDNTCPVIGIVYAPALDLLYWAEAGQGAWREHRNTERVRVRSRRADLNRLSLVASKDHAGPQVKALLHRWPTAEMLSMGSSLKFCLVAEGKADLYLRDGPTMEWDTAAAQCIVEEAGGVVQTLDGQRLRYGKSEFRNPELLTLGDPAFPFAS